MANNILTLLNRANRVVGEREPSPEPVRKLSPSEVELQSFQERARQDEVKRLLGEFRRKDSGELLRGQPMEGGATIFKEKKSLLDSKNVLNVKSTILNGNNILNSKSNLLASTRKGRGNPVPKAKGFAGGFFFNE